MAKLTVLADYAEMRRQCLEVLDEAVDKCVELFPSSNASAQKTNNFYQSALEKIISEQGQAQVVDNEDNSNCDYLYQGRETETEKNRSGKHSTASMTALMKEYCEVRPLSSRIAGKDFARAISKAATDCNYSKEKILVHSTKKPRKKKKQNIEPSSSPYDGKCVKSNIPNYFVAFRVSDPEIRSNLADVQKHIIEQDGELCSCVIPLPTLHVTLAVMHIANAEEHSRALLALRKVYNEFEEEFSASPLELEFKGLGHFRRQVVFAKITPDNALNRLNVLLERIHEQCENNSVGTVGKKRFSPHTTIMKLCRGRRLFRRGIRRISRSLYLTYEDKLFGTQVVESMQLLSMNEPKDEKGYYKGHEFPFSVREKRECK